MKSLIAGTVLLGAASLSRGNRVGLGETPDYRGWDESAIKTRGREHYSTGEDYLFTAPVIRLIGLERSAKNEFRVGKRIKMRGSLRYLPIFRYGADTYGVSKWYPVNYVAEDTIEYL
jgi:hypothetical protein